MNKIDELNSKLFQTSILDTGLNCFRVNVKQNNFIAGTIKPNEKTFICVPRSPKNLFRLFGGGLGLNDELLNVILPYFGVEKIFIPYQDTILTTTTAKWRMLGIVSPFCDQKVDKQVILSVSLINLEDAEEYHPVNSSTKQLQLGLF